MKIAFAECGPDRLDALMSFFGRVYSPSHPLACNEQLLRWQFRGPVNSSGHYHVKLALAGDDVQASLGYIPVDLTVSGRTVRAAWTANWMVDPGSRRLGLGPLLLRELMAEFDAVLSIGLEREACQILPRMGWNDFGDLTRYVCVINPADAAQLTEDGSLKWPTVPHPSLDPARHHAPTDAVAGDDPAAIWDRVWAGTGAGTKRSAAFLNWRYVEHPALKYRFVRARNADGELVALAIYRVEQVRGLSVRVGRIVELMTDSTQVQTLMDAVHRDARAAGVAVLDFFCATRRFAEALLDAGFLAPDSTAATQFPVVFQPIDRRRTGIRFMAHFRNGVPVAGLDDWYVTKGDGDQDRPN